LMKCLRRRFRFPHHYVDRMKAKQMRLNNDDIMDKEDESKVVELNEKEIAFKIQLGISQLLYSWMHQYWDQDFMQHPRLQKEIFDFQKDIDRFIVDKGQSAVIHKLLKEPINTNINHHHSVSSNRSESHSLSQSVSALRLDDAKEEIRTRWPHLSLHTIPIPNSFVILSYKPHDIAQQIVLMDYYVFRAIKPRELVAQAWKKEDKWSRASNLLRMINQFNSVCRWIQLAVLQNTKSVKDRSKMIKHMILIAKTLYDHQDFSALCAVHGALVSTPIKRLTKEWKKINKKYIKIIENISTLFQWNSPKLIQLHSTSKGPVIPHLGIILKNVISIEESDEYKPDGTINRTKMNLLAKQVEKLNKWQRQCSIIYNDDQSQRKININNKKFIIKKNILIQKLLFRDFERQINISDDDIFKLTQSIK